MENQEVLPARPSRWKKSSAKNWPTIQMSLSFLVRITLPLRSWLDQGSSWWSSGPCLWRVWYLHLDHQCLQRPRLKNQLVPWLPWEGQEYRSDSSSPQSRYWKWHEPSRAIFDQVQRFTNKHEKYVKYRRKSIWPSTYSEIMIRHGELFSIKGKNRMRFINKLRNIQDVLSIYPAVKVKRTDRAHAYLHGTDYEPVAESLKASFWDPKFLTCLQDWKISPALKAAVQGIMKEISRTAWPLKSQVSVAITLLNSMAWTQSNLGWCCLWSHSKPFRPKWKKPDIKPASRNWEEAVLHLFMKPLKQVALLLGRLARDAHVSGGIDSPVAATLVLEAWGGYRGGFASPPLIPAPGALEKAHDLTRKGPSLGQYPIYRGALHRDPRGDKAPEAYLMTPDPSLYDAHYRPHSRGSRWRWLSMVKA